MNPNVDQAFWAPTGLTDAQVLAGNYSATPPWGGTLDSNLKFNSSINETGVYDLWMIQDGVTSRHPYVQLIILDPDPCDLGSYRPATTALVVSNGLHDSADHEYWNCQELSLFAMSEIYTSQLVTRTGADASHNSGACYQQNIGTFISNINGILDSECAWHDASSSPATSLDRDTTPNLPGLPGSGDSLTASFGQHQLPYPIGISPSNYIDLAPVEWKMPQQITGCTLEFDVYLFSTGDASYDIDVSNIIVDSAVTTCTMGTNANGARMVCSPGDHFKGTLLTNVFEFEVNGKGSWADDFIGMQNAIGSCPPATCIAEAYLDASGVEIPANCRAPPSPPAPPTAPMTLGGACQNVILENYPDDLLPSGPSAWYRPGDWDLTAGTWVDATGNGNTATLSGTASVGLPPTEFSTVCQDSGHGAIVNVSALHGTPESQISFGKILGHDKWTICSATRYVDESAYPLTSGPNSGGVSQDRILQIHHATTQSNPAGMNWLHGHHNSNAGVAYYYGEKTTWKNNISPNTNWLIMCGGNSQLTNTKLANFQDVGTALGGGPTSSAAEASLVINFPKEISADVTCQTPRCGTHFAVAELIVWPRWLSDAELHQGSSYLWKNVLGIDAPPAPPAPPPAPPSPPAPPATPPASPTPATPTPATPPVSPPPVPVSPPPAAPPTVYNMVYEQSETAKFNPSATGSAILQQGANYATTVFILRNDLGGGYGEEWVDKIEVDGVPIGECVPDGSDYDCTYYECSVDKGDLPTHIFTATTSEIPLTVNMVSHSKDCNCDMTTWECEPEYPYTDPVTPGRLPMTAVARFVFDYLGGEWLGTTVPTGFTNKYYKGNTTSAEMLCNTVTGWTTLNFSDCSDVPGCDLRSGGGGSTTSAVLDTGEAGYVMTGFRFNDIDYGDINDELVSAFRIEYSHDAVTWTQAFQTSSRTDFLVGNDVTATWTPLPCRNHPTACSYRYWRWVAEVHNCATISYVEWKGHVAPPPPPLPPQSPPAAPPAPPAAPPPPATPPTQWAAVPDLGCDFTLMRRSSAGSGIWHQATDNLQGVDVYGTPCGPTDECDFSIRWDNINYTHFLFSTGDERYWVMATLDSIIGEEYSGAQRPIIADNLNPTDFDFTGTKMSAFTPGQNPVAGWYNRNGGAYIGDPQLGGNLDPTSWYWRSTLLYVEDSISTITEFKATQQGVNVFICVTRPPAPPTPPSPPVARAATVALVAPPAAPVPAAFGEECTNAAGDDQAGNCASSHSISTGVDAQQFCTSLVGVSDVNVNGVQQVCTGFLSTSASYNQPGEYCEINGQCLHGECIRPTNNELSSYCAPGQDFPCGIDQPVRTYQSQGTSLYNDAEYGISGTTSQLNWMHVYGAQHVNIIDDSVKIDQCIDETTGNSHSCAFPTANNTRCGGGTSDHVTWGASGRRRLEESNSSTQPTFTPFDRVALLSKLAASFGVTVHDWELGVASKPLTSSTLTWKPSSRWFNATLYPAPSPPPSPPHPPPPPPPLAPPPPPQPSPPPFPPRPPTQPPPPALPPIACDQREGKKNTVTEFEEPLFCLDLPTTAGCHNFYSHTLHSNRMRLCYKPPGGSLCAQTEYIICPLA